MSSLRTVHTPVLLLGADHGTGIRGSAQARKIPAEPDVAAQHFNALACCPLGEWPPACRSVKNRGYLVASGDASHFCHRRLCLFALQSGRVGTADRVHGDIVVVYVRSPGAQT